VKWPQEFTANDVAGLINDNTFHNAREQLVREFLLPGAPTGYTFSADSIGRALKKHLDETVKGDDGRTLVLRKRENKHKKSYTYHVEVMPKVGR
jgi:hypothetical protein